jgi:hypothetical protein
MQGEHMIQQKGDVQMTFLKKNQARIDALSATHQNTSAYNSKARNNRAFEQKKLGPAEFALIRDRQIIAICNLFGYRRLV